jgi:hypothetical protein
MEADCGSLQHRVVAHPPTGCASNNNAEKQEATCKKVTGENPWRQPVVPNEKNRCSTSKDDLRRGQLDPYRLDALDAGSLESVHAFTVTRALLLLPRHNFSQTYVARALST